MKLIKMSESDNKQKPIWMLFAFFIGLGLYAQVGDTESLKDLSGQLEIIASNREIVIPPVYLTDLTDLLSNKTDTINSSLVYNTNANEYLMQGYYYWHAGSWHKLFPKTDPVNYLFLWNVENVELAYLDKSGDVRVVGISAIEKAKFLSLESDAKTLKYESENGGHMLVNLGQIVGEEETVTTLVYLQDDTLLFIDHKGRAVSVPLDESPLDAAIVASGSPETKDFEDAIIETKTQTEQIKASLLQGVAAVSITKESDVDEQEDNEVEPEEAEAEELVRSDSLEDEDTLTADEAPVIEEEKEVRLGREIKSIEDNEDGTFTIVYAGGSKFTSRDLNHPEGGLKNVDRELVDVVNNGDGSFTAVFSDGSTLLSSEMKDFKNFGGSPEEGYPGVEIVIDNGDGTYNIILTDGTELSSVDLEALSNPKREIEDEGRGVLSIVQNEDETYTVTFTDGTEMNSKDLSEIYQPLGQLESREEEVDAPIAEQAALEKKQAAIAASSGLEVDEVKEAIGGETSHAPIQKAVPQNRGVKAIEERIDGTYVVSLTDGTAFVTPSFYAEGDDRSEARHIESITDNNDGTFIVGLTGGIKLASIETLRLPDPILEETQEGEDVPDIVEAEVSDEVEGLDETEATTAEKAAIDSADKQSGDAADQSEDSEVFEHALEDQVEEGGVNESAMSVNGAQTDLDDGESNASDSLESDVSAEDENPTISQAELIRLQKEEIEALKRKDKENEEELREMNERLRRLEKAFGDPNRSAD